MNQTVKLVTLWGAFEEQHPNGNIEDFCRHYLASQRQKKVKGPMVGGVIPPVADGVLLKTIGRIHKLNSNYANLSLKGTGLNQLEELGLLLTIRQEKNPKKTELIYANLFEVSSGTDMLTRLKTRGLIKEHNDKEDKRSKRIELTAKGEKTVEAAKARIIKNAAMMTHDLTEDDKQLCIQLLKNIEIKFSALWQKHKGKEFDEIYEEMMEEDKK
ncbi:MAG TPA: winged helix DNA-binding protein [Chitinophaga sp.]|uniref:MarR family winged helix-turn-helix transcriptional regulator n=1 Tax=Chitinophaga sp. TaxID=1869181 RepID=UPI002B7DEE2A|nr:winged helix DNA-binding protein [Chitinophaga sp.]HVI44394.1 winged helix DNA-binding protein [Chitinophaga sp.]